MFRLEIEGLDELQRDWTDAQRALSDGARRGVELAIREGAAEARNTRHYKDQTGLLTASIGGRVEVSTHGGAEGVLSAETPYASFVDGGTRPHVIEGRPYLAFPGNGGETVMVRRVNHPGTQPDGFMGRAYLKAERVIEREVDVAADRAADIMNR